MLTPTPVKPVEPKHLLDQQFAEHAPEMMRQMGATNTEGPLPLSPYLKNIKTGVILPWSAPLAEQRDIMVNCDIDGNTDPVMWQRVDMSSTVSEADMLSYVGYMQDAMAAAGDYNKYEHGVPTNNVELNKPVKFPDGALPMLELAQKENFKDENSQMLANLDGLL